MNTIATIHQPHFLPWMGYYNKLVNSDVFIILDDVQYRKLYFQNRTYIKDMHGDKHLITIPVKTKHLSKINEVIIENSNWKLPLLRLIEYSYKKTSYFDAYWPVLSNLIESKNNYLIDLLLDTLHTTINILGLNSLKIIKSSTLQLSSEPTQRIIELCKYTDSNSYIFGEGGGLMYHNMELLKQSNLVLYQQDFKMHHPKYMQKWGVFISGLSIIDPLFNVGAEETYKLLKESWTINDNFILNR